MADFTEYLDWRGDLTFQAAPFNEIDDLLLSYLSYVNFDGILPEDSETEMTIAEAGDLFFGMHTEEELKSNRSFIRLAPRVLRKMAASKRFASFRLRNYVNHIDLEKEEQFSAVEIRCAQFTYISYRGTDDTIVGWKEDFNISCQVTPAEDEAVAFLNRLSDGLYLPVRLGGHSKGGHLAVYAASMCERSIQDHIISIGDFDGPGFQKEFLESDGYRTIRDRIHRYIPETSIVGMLLEMDVEPVIISSTENGPMQHDAFSWEVLGTHFVTASELSMEGKLFDETLTAWLTDVDMADRKPYIDDLFSVLEASGAETLTDLQKGGVKAITQMLQQMARLNSSTARTTRKLLSLLFENWLNASDSQRFKLLE
ncbi:MAG: DUF2974 domain-containing protein [Lachnospiraceae bacterium]|nr:DUF2974 domain-containing protein [Lachnospiraceae bacterium]